MSQGSAKKLATQDISHPKFSQSGFDLKLFDSLVNGVIIIDRNFKLLYVNPAVQQMCGLHSNRIGRKELSSILSFEPDILAIDLTTVVEATPYRELTMKPAANPAAKVQVTLQALPGQILGGAILPCENPDTQQWLIFIHDVTLEERLQKKYFEQLKEKEEFIKKLDRKLFETSLMFELAQGMNFFKELGDILNLILTKIEDAFAFTHSVAGTVNRESQIVQTVIVRQSGSALAKLTRAIHNDWIKSFYMKAIAVGEPCFFKKGENQAIDVYVSEVFSVSYSNYLFVPLIHKEEFGFVILLDSKQEWRGDDDDLSLLFGIANQLLLAIDNNRRYEDSMVDPLTGLYNVRYFQESLLLEFNRAKLSEKPFSLLMIDVDFFKKFNDTHGHATGDLVLKQVANAIFKTCRETDTVARYGGEEFVVILPETDSRSAFFAAERIRKRIESVELKVGDQTLKITASVGAASFPELSSDISELTSRADLAMYAVKKSGRNNSKVYTADMEEALASPKKKNEEKI